MFNFHLGLCCSWLRWKSSASKSATSVMQLAKFSRGSQVDSSSVKPSHLARYWGRPRRKRLPMNFSTTKFLDLSVPPELGFLEPSPLGMICDLSQLRITTKTALPIWTSCNQGCKVKLKNIYLLKKTKLLNPNCLYLRPSR